MEIQLTDKKLPRALEGYSVILTGESKKHGAKIHPAFIPLDVLLKDILKIHLSDYEIDAYKERIECYINYIKENK